jgi:glycerophosphoryl diester phosphodiesterase
VNPLLDLSARLVIGHRGNAARAPENTIVSFDQALALGADALEFDVRVTRDGVPVVIHDESLLRTAGRSELVAALPLTEVASADAGATFTIDGSTVPYAGRGITVPTLAAVLDRYAGVPKIIEVKVPAAVESTRLAIRAAGAEREVLVDSSDLLAVLPFRDGTVATGPSMSELARLLPRVLLPGGPSTLPYESICIPRVYNGMPIPVRQLARLVRRAGVTTHVWTINAPDVAVRLWRSGVQGIISDDPATMIGARRTMT